MTNFNNDSKVILEVPVLEVPIKYNEIMRSLADSFAPAINEYSSAMYSFILPTGYAYQAILANDQPGFVLMFTNPTIIRTSYHDINLTGYIHVFGDNIDFKPGGEYTLTRDFNIDLSMYHSFSINRVEFWFKNLTGIDVTLSIACEVIAVEKAFFENVIRPVLEVGLEHIKDHSEYIKGSYSKF